MRLDHEFTIPVPAERAWPVLLDVERAASCLPGASITRINGTAPEGREIEGKLKVKVGPITVTYGGAATFAEIDEVARRAVISARGKEARGSGTADATITAQLHDAGDSTRVTVRTELSVTGRSAQLGRDVLANAGTRLFGRFADSLAAQLAVEGAVEPVGPVAGPVVGLLAEPVGLLAEPAAEAAGEPADYRGDRDTSDRDAPGLLDPPGAPVLRRLAPVLAVFALVAALIAVVRRTHGHPPA
ncbi:MAG TPA: SRPBCC family protein [Mycobacteriales bacterium]|nr:SRPBCC family protein [Mycobacteriales bacterium]